MIEIVTPSMTTLGVKLVQTREEVRDANRRFGKITVLFAGVEPGKEQPNEDLAWKHRGTLAQAGLGLVSIAGKAHIIDPTGRAQNPVNVFFQIIEPEQFLRFVRSVPPPTSFTDPFVNAIEGIVVDALQVSSADSPWLTHAGLIAQEFKRLGLRQADDIARLNRELVMV